ncbi:hypothetical protein [Micromonospora sp. NPDC006431]|uniref:hypothetical protein n=1 Tax=Micromonospora sp. NPDC006431 TaxID=3364235 RepID=UPI0036C484AF
MAFRTWGRLLLTALVVSLLAGAGQLGIAYGFGVVRLNGAFIDDSVNRWPAQLVWVAWFAAIAAVTGAVLTERFARRDGLPGGTSEQLAVAGAAALGAIVVAPLCMQPARAAELGGTIEPVWAVGICAILGAVVGAGAAIAVLLKPPLGWNIALSAGAVWLLALVSAAPSVAPTGPLLSVRLGVLEPSWLDPAPAQRLAALIMPTVALLAGAAVGALARRRGHSPLVGGAAGAAGPVLLAFAYLTAGPGVATDRYQLAPYYGALVAVAAGALGSAATTVLRRPVAETETTAIEPTDILQPLPSSPAGPGDPGFAAEPATDSLAAAEGTAIQSSLPEAGREPTPRSAGVPAPAHWDWPRASGLTPSPRPTHRSRADRTTPDRTGLDNRTISAEHTAFEDRPAPAGPIEIEGSSTSADRAGVDHRTIAADHAASVEPATPAGRGGADERGSADEPGPLAGAAAGPEPEASPSPAGDAGSDVPEAVRDADDLTQTLPVPGLLPPRRRTAAIDVLAAGRPAPDQAVKPQESTAAAPAPAPATLPERMPSPDVAALAGAAPSPRTETPAEPEPDHSAPLGEAATTSPTVPRGGGRPDHEAPAGADGDDPATPAPAARPTAGRRSRRQPRPAPAAAKAVPAEAGSGRLAETGPRTESPAGDAAAPVQVGQEPAAAAPANPSAAEAAAGAGDPGSTSTRPGSRSGRGRKTRTSPATATAPSGAASPVPAPSTEATPAEAAPSAAAPTEAKPAESTPAAAASTDAKPAESAPAAAAPTDAKPAESAPAAAAPTDAKPAESAPSAAIPTEAKPAQATRAHRRPARTASTGAVPARAPRIEADPAQAAPIEAPHARTTPEVPPADPHPAAPVVDVPARSASPATPPAPRAAGDLDQRPGGRTPLIGAEPADATADPQTNEGGRRTRSYFFSDDEPAATDLPGPADAPASPRPRFSIFEDVTDRPDEALPTGPVALPPSQPVGPRDVAAPDSGGGDPTGATGSTTGTPDRTEAPTGAARVEPMPRPRHRALPDLGRDAHWDAFANARQATPLLRNAPQAGGRHTDTIGSPTAGEEDGEPGDGRSKLRGLFRRNRAKGTPGDAGRESESLAQDEEYVDWVAGLASDDGEDIPTLRGGRHHRD